MDLVGAYTDLGGGQVGRGEWGEWMYIPILMIVYGMVTYQPASERANWGHWMSLGVHVCPGRFRVPPSYG